jgi:hypothetical protein
VIQYLERVEWKRVYGMNKIKKEYRKKIRKQPKLRLTGLFTLRRQ